ncbi:MAG: DUF86 domain-containing protein [Candidatus Micrarchaeota archaeon]|nr:DUF86 domain-containing protein [Candidatus Micrarchaeota archaeon]
MKEPKVFLAHILESINAIEGYVSGKNFYDFRGDTELQDAVVRRLEVIGEATKALPIAFKEKHREAEWKKAAAMRDILTHQYFSVDAKVVWETVKGDIPRFKKGVLKALEDFG